MCELPSESGAGLDITGEKFDLGGSAAASQPVNRKHLVLLICCVSLFMNYLDSTILNVALPVLQRVFHADEAALQWIVDSFLLVLTCLLVLAGSLADRFGRRKILVIGLVIFTIGSLGCSISNNVSELVAARMVAGVGGSMLVPTTLSIIRNTFTDRHDLARAIGVWSGVYGIACASGPLIGGLLIDNIGWRSIFLVNIPVGIVGVVLAVRYVPESIAVRVRGFDVFGQILIIAVLGVLVFTIIEAPGQGWASMVTLLGFALSILLFLLFLFVEARQDEPLFEIRFFSNPAFAGANILAIVTFVLMTGFLFLNTIYLQQVRGLSAFTAGLFTLPLMLALATCAPLSGRYLAHHGPRRVMTSSSLVGALAFTLLLFTHPHSSGLYLCVAYALLGIALGSINPTITHTSVSSMPAEQAGVASAITSTSRQIGSSFGVAVLGSVVITSFHNSMTTSLTSLGLTPTTKAAALHASVSALSAQYAGATDVIHRAAGVSYTNALHVAWWIGIGLCVLWFFVARHATTTKALERSRVAGNG